MQVVSLFFILPVLGVLETVELFPGRHTPTKYVVYRQPPQKQRRLANTCSVESRTFKAGEKFTLARTGPCVVYVCRRSGGYAVINQEQYCRDGYNCWALNTIRVRACSIEMCTQDTDGEVKFVTVQEGCNFNNKCHRVGSTWYHECRFYICRKMLISLGIIFKVELLGGRCRDIDGNCHDPGDFFAHKIGDTVYDFCSCSFSEGRFLYNCLP